MNVQEIQALAEDTWVNEFMGSITSANNRQVGDGTVSSANLGDVTGTIKIETWDHNLLKYQGKEVSFKGKGAVIKEYNGTKFIKLLKVAKLNVVGDAQEPSGERPANMEPAAPKGAVAQAPAVSGDPYLGQTICYCIAPAAQLAAADPESDGFIKKQLVKNYIRVLYESARESAEEIRETL
jgi:hypothetical protein